MSKSRPGIRECDPCFYRTQIALALVKQHHRDGQRLKSKSQDLLARLKQHKKREADLLQKIKEPLKAEGLDSGTLTLKPQAQAEDLEKKLLQVRGLVKRGMASLDEQNERLETHLRNQRALYEHILDETGLISKDDVHESLWQHDEVQHEMKSLSEDMARLDKLMQDFHGKSRASDAALLSRHVSLERNRVYVSGNVLQDSVQNEGSAPPWHPGHVAKSHSDVPTKQSGGRRSGFFQRTPRKVLRPVRATPTEVDDTPKQEESPPTSRKRQRSLLMAEMERLQSETKKLERDAEESEVLVEVVTVLSQESKEEPAAHQRLDVESILNSPSDDVSGESNLCNDASTIGTPFEPVLTSSASPSTDLLQGAEQDDQTSFVADELGYDWVVSADATATPSEVLTTDLLDRGDGRSVIKKIDFDNVELSETCDAHSSSSSVTCESDMAAGGVGDGVESENGDGGVSRHNTTSEHPDETASIDEEFVCESVESSSGEEDDEGNSETFSESLTGSDDEDSNSVEVSDSDPEVSNSGRTLGRALSPLLSDHCSGNEQQEVPDAEGNGSETIEGHYDGTSSPKKENGSCGHLDKKVTALGSEIRHLQCPPQDVQTEDQAGGSQELTQQVALYADQVKEMRQTLDWFQENLRQEENNRQAAELQSEQLSDLCADQAMKLEALGHQRDAFENRWKELHMNMESKLKVQHQEDLEVEATIAASDSCTQQGLIPEWKQSEETRNRLLEEQKQLLADQLKEGERLRCSLESKVLALRRQVEQLESSRQITEEMGELICYQNRVWRLGWRLTVQSFLFFLAVYIWLKNFRSEVGIPLPT